MGICQIAIIKKDIKYWHNILVEPENGLALLGMPQCEGLQLLTVNCDTSNQQKDEKVMNNKTR